MRVAMTGATGLLGRNLLFELVKRHLGRLEDLEVFVLGRPKRPLRLHDRMEKMLFQDGLAYFSLAPAGTPSLRRWWRRHVTCLEMDLDQARLGLQPDDVKELRAARIDYFFHLAARTDFRSSPDVVDQLLTSNVRGTWRVLDLVSSMPVREFCYVSSAYSCGAARGRIRPDDVNQGGPFRNPYERTKLVAERLVKRFAERTGVRCRVFRPSTLCGRLIEPEFGATPKFDVFYACAAFFLRLKRRMMPRGHDVYGTPIHLDIRLCRNPRSGLNIVPADYAAKVMYEVCTQGAPGDTYHLVNSEDTPHDLYVPMMLEAVNVQCAALVDSVPDGLNPLERLYYRTVGGIYTPYTTAAPMRFDTANLRSVLRAAQLGCPRVNRANFLKLMEYAKRRDFGLERRDTSASLHPGSPRSHHVSAAEKIVSGVRVRA